MKHIEKVFKISVNVEENSKDASVEQYLNHNNIGTLLHNYSEYDRVYFEVDELPLDKETKPINIKINFKRRESDTEEEKIYNLREAEGIAGLLMLCQTVMFDSFRWERVPNEEVIKTDGFIKKRTIDGIVYEVYIEIDDDKHIVGDKDCSECWGDSFPRKCKCGGLVHSQYYDENWDGDVYLHFKCDKCNDDYETIDD